MTRDEAEKLSILMLQLAGRLNESAAYVRDKDDEANFHQFRRGVGKAMYEVFSLGEMIWARFPDLKPEGLGGTYKVDLTIYEQRFYEWDGGPAAPVAGQPGRGQGE